MLRRVILLSLCLCMVSSGEEPKSISGIYPTLAMYNNEGECGTGAVVPWAGKLWVITYGPHKPKGSSDKLYSISKDLIQTVHPESIGGTPANRMIHKESQQLFIGPYAIDKNGKVRAIPYSRMPGRLTANARHLTDPANKIYCATMEEGLYTIDVKTLEVVEHIIDGNSKKGVGRGVQSNLPGYHGKGLYSGYGRVIYANNGEKGKNVRTDPTVTSGALAQWFGKGDWQLVRRNQFTEVTGPGGIYGNPNPDTDPIWAVGWDYRSLILMLLENGKWHAYRLPKSSHSYDGAHGWNTEWPRIRDIGEDDLMMTMHGCFWHFPKNFRTKTSAGIRPRTNYLKVVGDFCRWGDRVVLGCDDSAQKEFLNHRPFKSTHGAPGQSNSNLWFVSPDTLDKLGPVIGRGSVWLRDDVKANEPSDPFLFSGYDHRMIQLSHSTGSAVTFILEVDREGNGTWSRLRSINVPANGAKYHIFTASEKGAWIRVRTDKAATKVSAHFHYRNRDPRATKADAMFAGVATVETANAIGGVMRCLGGNKRTMGLIAVDRESGASVGYYVLDANLNLKKSNDTAGRAYVSQAVSPAAVFDVDAASVIFVEDGKRYRIPKGVGFGAAEKKAVALVEPQQKNLALNAKVTVSSTHASFKAENAVDGKTTEASRWVSKDTGEKWIVLDLGKPQTIACAQVTSGYKKSSPIKAMKFQQKLNGTWADIPGGAVTNNSSVTATINFAKPIEAQEIRLASTDSTYVRIYEVALYAKPKKATKTVGGLNVARVCREVATERDLLSCQGTFYELPARNAQGFAKIRPVASHELAVHDYCSYRGLMLLTGIDPAALKSGNKHIIVSNDGKAAVWAGAIDDLWKLGKAVGQGGPWKDTAVKAGTPSDPYLMTAYDKKTVTIQSSAKAEIRLEVDIDGTGVWVPYKTFSVGASAEVKHEFPEGYSAYWVRAKSSVDTTATVWFVYE